jgi:nucleotide-binding universal stress UspA family protein
LIVSAARTLVLAERLSTIELQGWLDDGARNAVQRASATLTGRFGRVESRVVHGDARDAVLCAARDWKADLIVMGVRGLAAVERFLLGSVSLGIARHADCPVLVVRGEPRPLRNIVVGVDGSDQADAAARLLATLPLSAETVVHVVAVVESLRYPVVAPDLLGGALGSDFTAVMEELNRAMVRVASHAKRFFPPGCKVETLVLEGQPAAKLVGACETVNADLLVVGARGVGGFERLLLGSVSDAVLRHAASSVLIVRPRV